LLAESQFGRLRIRHQELIDLKAEGLVSAEEIKTHLLATLDKWGSPPIALVLPQEVSISQVIDVPPAPESEIKKLIEDESVRLSGVSESRIVYDFVRIDTGAKNRQQFWVTLCQEGDIREPIARLGLDHEDLCDVTTTANALIAAYRASAPSSSRAILVHMGAQTTVVVVLLAGQGAFATSFHMGGDFLTRALARGRDCSDDEAEAVKRSKDLLAGPQTDPQFVTAVDGWVAELNRQLKEWFEHNPAIAAERQSFQLIASGGGFEQPGLIEYIKTRAGLSLSPWPAGKSSRVSQPAKGFEVAFGTALQALGYSAQPVSLLPDDYRVAWQKRLSRQRLEFANLLVLLTCVMVFALGTWHNLSLINRKHALLAKIEAGQEAVYANDALTGDLLAEYETFRPLFAAQENTLDTLKTLSLLQQSRSNRNCWYVLVADQQSYFTQPLTLSSTNRTGKTNLVANPAPSWVLPNPWGLFTNASLARPGLIAELCVPEDAEVARRSLVGQIVNELQHQPLFSKADLLPEDLRRPLADPKVVLADRYFALELDFAETDFQRLPAGRRSPGASSVRPPRRSRLSSSPSESAEGTPENLK
jgi:Tfp pilus assembly PilM family ATPase